MFWVHEVHEKHIIHIHKTVQKLSVEQWTLNTLNERHIGEGGSGVMVLRTPSSLKFK